MSFVKSNEGGQGVIGGFQPLKREQLVIRAKELGIKSTYRMKKVDLEWAIYLKESLLWFNDIAGNTITITNEDTDISLNVIDLNEKILTDYKMKDISREKQMWWSEAANLIDFNLLEKSIQTVNMEELIEIYPKICKMYPRSIQYIQYTYKHQAAAGPAQAQGRALVYLV